MVLVVMGVSGAGKTTVGSILASNLDWPFQEGDALHPRANVDKMTAGRPLDDADRAPWIEAVAEWIDARLEANENGIITCSALRRAYRDVLDRRGRDVTFVYLSGRRETIAGRLASRLGHFMPAALLSSQLADLQPPGSDEPALTVDVDSPPAAIAEEIIERLGLSRGPLTPRRDRPGGRGSG